MLAVRGRLARLAFNDSGLLNEAIAYGLMGSAGE
jgi:hypothetical protein